MGPVASWRKLMGSANCCRSSTWQSLTLSNTEAKKQDVNLWPLISFQLRSQYQNITGSSRFVSIVLLNILSSFRIAVRNVSQHSGVIYINNIQNQTQSVIVQEALSKEVHLTERAASSECYSGATCSRKHLALASIGEA